MNKKKVCVITCDLKGSRKLKNRKKVQENLKKTLKIINKKFEENLLTKFMIIRGDEFQGVLKTSENVYTLFSYLKDSLSLNIYCGIGIGKISTKISKIPIEMDGKAFYNSREALNEAKKLKFLVRVKSDDNFFDQTINTILTLTETIKSRWSKRQREIINYFRKNKNLTYSDLGKKFRVSKQSIAQTLKVANWDKIERAEEVIQKLLNSIK